MVSSAYFFFACVSIHLELNLLTIPSFTALFVYGVYFLPNREYMIGFSKLGRNKLIKGQYMLFYFAALEFASLCFLYMLVKRKLKQNMIPYLGYLLRENSNRIFICMFVMTMLLVVQELFTLARRRVVSKCFIINKERRKTRTRN